MPALDEDYEFTCGMLSNAGRDVEFRVEVDAMSGKYSVTASELLELKGRAAKLFIHADHRHHRQIHATNFFGCIQTP